MYAVLPLPAEEWQKLLRGLFSGQGKVEILVCCPPVHHLAAPGTCHGFFPNASASRGVGEEQAPWDFFRDFFFSLKGRKEDIPPSARMGSTKRDLKVFSIA